MQRKGQPIMILTCQHDSHYFEERTIVVNDIIKVGRAVARSKASPNNAIFDCKVLSRNHAVIWFSSDEFWLRDTNSSNGTFVNNTRVSKRDDSDYCDRQIFSGDVIRFGVDVVEHDTTHGCIIATVTLFLPNGQEAKPKLGHTGDALPSGLISINHEQMFQISCFLNDAIFREQALDNKLESLRLALQEATSASEKGWQAMVNEEKLLQKFDLYESQMQLFKEELSESSLKLRLSDLLEEKSIQEAQSKTQLTKLIKEKEIALQRVKELERIISDLHEECNHLRNEFTSAQEACSNISEDYKSNLSTISQRLSDLNAERTQLNGQLQNASQENGALRLQLEHTNRELAELKELYDRAQSKANESDTKNAADLCKVADITPFQSQSTVDSGKSATNEYISDCIRDFHRALELMRALDSKISAISVTTDLDEERKPEANNKLSADSISVVDDISNLSSSWVDSLIKRIVRHNEAAMTSLHAYLRQVNPSAAAELINKIYLTNSIVDEVPEAPCDNADCETFKRPNFLTLDKAVEAVASSYVLDEGVTVAGADSLNASPTVSSGNGSMCFSTTPDIEEVAHLRECVRIANEEIEQYKTHLAELQKRGGDKTTVMVSTTGITAVGVSEIRSEQDLEEMRAECCVLRARLGDIEEQMEQTRENHRRLVEETHQHRTEVEHLRSQRAELEEALAEAKAQVARLYQQQQQQSHATSSHRTPVNSSPASSSSCMNDSSVHVDRLELAPGRLVTASSLTVIPLMLLLFAVMFAIFSKFVS